MKTTKRIFVFATTLLLAPSIILHHEVYGIKPRDPDYREYLDEHKQPKTPYDNFVTNACLTKIFYEGDQTVVFDTKGLKESGLEYIDPNACFEIAKQTLGYFIDKVEPYGEGDMKITLTKK